MRNNLKTYQKVNRESSLLAADPHTVILMLFDGLLDNMSVAKGAIERKDLVLKSEKLTKSINIIRSLQSSLDSESEPQISENFSTLYSYCIEQLIDASVSLDTSIIDSVAGLLKPLRDAWRDISEADKAKGFAKINEKKQQATIQAAGV